MGVLMLTVLVLTFLSDLRIVNTSELFIGCKGDIAVSVWILVLPNLMGLILGPFKPDVSGSEVWILS